MNSKTARQLRKAAKDRLPNLPWCTYKVPTYHDTSWVPAGTLKPVIIQVVNPITMETTCQRAVYKRLKRVHSRG